MTAISIDKGRIVDTIRAAHPNTQSIYLYGTWGAEYQRRDCFSISHPGETWQAFVCEFMVPLITPETDIYKELKTDIFGDGDALAGTQKRRTQMFPRPA